MLGWLERLGGKHRRAERARRQELHGDLAGAALAYLDAEMPAEAARVLLLQADGERDPERRMALCGQAARVGQGTEHGQRARRRKALLAYDLARDVGGAVMAGELGGIARELEACGAWQEAAECYALLGDEGAEVRVLEQAGAIEQLEQRLGESAQQARLGRERKRLLARIADLDAIGERREALRLGRTWLQTHADETVGLEVDRVAARLLAGPLVTLERDGERAQYALGSQVTIGRARATIAANHPSVSRQHLRLYRRDGVPFVEDLDTRNGTTLAGARVRTALPVGQGVQVELAGELPCELGPLDAAEPHGPLLIVVASEPYVVPLGPLSIGAWSLVDAHDGDDRFVVLRTPEGGPPPFMNGYQLGAQIELATGDEIRDQRDGPVVLRVPQPGPR